MIIHGKYLKALALLAPNKETTRPYLLGVHVEVKGSQAILVATDGAVLGALRVTLTEEFESQAFTIPLSLLTMITATDEVNLTCVNDVHGHGTVTLIQGDRGLSGKVVEGTYPPFRRVIPKEVSGLQERLIFSHDLDKVAKACTLINSAPMRAVHVHHNGGNACPIDTRNENFIVVISPAKHEFAQSYKLPAWLL